VVAHDPTLAGRCLAMLDPSDAMPAGAHVIAKVIRADGRPVTIIDRRADSYIRGLHYHDEAIALEDEPPAGDILSPRTATVVLRLVYDRFFESFGDHFGRTIIGIFTDAPNPLGKPREQNVHPGTTGIVPLITGGQLLVTGITKVWNSGTLSIIGGSLNTQSLDVSTAGSFVFGGGTITINGGTLSMPTAGATVGDGTSSAVLQLHNATVSTGSLTIAANSTLLGAGTPTTATTINPGATLAPSEGVGELTATAPWTLSTSGSSHSTLQIDIGAPTTPGTTYDQIVMDGGTFSAGGATLQLIPVTGVTLGTTYAIVTATGESIDSTMFSNLTAVPLTSNYLFSSGGTTADVTYSSSQIDVMFQSAVPTPEPTSLALLGLGGLLLRRRSKRGKGMMRGA
jgi:hypothetical protein